jgi:hypothetical protein
MPHTQPLLQQQDLIPAPDTALSRKAVIRLHQPGYVAISISGSEAPDRRELEEYVHTVFKQAHGADIKHYLPKLMGLRDGKGQLLAVCGLRHASEGNLFLEHYLDSPVECILQRKTGEQISRQDIVEIGNLAVADPVHVRSLLASVSLYLHGTDTRWAVFTGLATLKNSLLKLNMQVHVLHEADILRLPAEERADWGSYYTERPHVMAVSRIQNPVSAEVEAAA